MTGMEKSMVILIALSVAPIVMISLQALRSKY
jgi:hypothetical protein